MNAETFEGFLEAVEPYQARGWAYDPANPQRAMTIEILLGGQVIGTVLANLYRQDLEQNAVGAGDHAFIFNFDRRLEADDRAGVVARVARRDGSFQTLSAPPVVAPVMAAGAAPLLTFPGVVSDAGPRPVFVLGAARSGTSAMAQALLKLGRFKGHQEGHLLDLLAHWSVGLDRFYDEKADDAMPGRDTTVSLVPLTFFQDALDEIFIRATAMIFPDGDWIDKTPNSNMVYLAPRFRRMWPNARFIFMKRRFLENAASRARKFPEYDFAKNCQEWSDTMQAWLDVRDALRGVAVEVDQRFLGQQPEATAAALQGLLGLGDIETARVAQALRHDHPERTSDADAAGFDLARMGWPAEAHRHFALQCAGLMDAFGYATDAGYYQPGREGNGLVVV